MSIGEISSFLFVSSKEIQEKVGPRVVKTKVNESPHVMSVRHLVLPFILNLSLGKQTHCCPFFLNEIEINILVLDFGSYIQC